MRKTIYTKQALDAMGLDVLNGMGRAEARKRHGISHSPAELYMWELEWYCAELPTPGTGAWTFSPEAVAYLRHSGWSWGRIAVALASTESKVRSTFEAATSVRSEGLRIGKGGRWLDNDEVLYADELRRTGTELKVGSELSNRQQATVQRLMHLEVTELRAMAKDLGLKVPANGTKVKLAMAIAKA